MLHDLTARLVDACRRHALLVTLAALATAALLALYTVGHLGMDTDPAKLLDPDLPWRRQEMAIDRAFPHKTDNLVVVIDGVTAPVAEAAAARLALRLQEQPALFHEVRRPDALDFFRRNGLLFLSVPELRSLVNQLSRAQPFLSALAADPSLHGLFGALNRMLEGVAQGDAARTDLDAPLTTLADTVDGVLAGRPQPLPWQRMFTGQAPRPEELRRFVQVQPVLDYGALQAGARATEAIRAAARDLGLTAESGVRVRITGGIAMADDEFATIADGMEIAGITSLALVVLLLFLAVRSVRLVVPILVTLVVGLIATAAFAAAAIGTLNPISVAFAVMFIGLGVDFGIQFSIRYRDVRHRVDDPSPAMRRTAREISGPLLLAAATTAVGFLSFVPTAYVGVAQLGLIAGAGMIVAVVLNLTLLPALLTLFRPRGEAEPVGYVWAGGIDRFLGRHRRAVLVGAAVLAAAGAALAPLLDFDPDPLHLRDPNTESVATVLDLMDQPETSPNSIAILAPSIPAATELAGRLETLPEVDRVITLTSFVPENQETKLAIIDDLNLLLGPSLSPARIRPPPTPAEVAETLEATVVRLRALAAPPGDPAARLADSLEAVLHRDPSARAAIGPALLAGLGTEIESLRRALEAGEVTLDSLPEELKRDWATPDGRALVEAYPKGDPRDDAILTRFAQAVRAVAPEATGAVITVREAGRTVIGAFIQAFAFALAATLVLLLAVLRRPLDVLRVLAPLGFAALLTVLACVLLGLSINFANIIALPLLLGISVAFNIYFVINWRAGVAHPLQSSTARAVLFSALTTAAGFGSLALSNHPGTASLGLLLTLGLTVTLAAALFLLPALLGPPENTAGTS